jgi:hypothetical protein
MPKEHFVQLLKGIVDDQMLRIALKKVQQQLVCRIDGLLSLADVFFLKAVKDGFQHYAKNHPFSCRQIPKQVLLDRSTM